MLIRSTNSGVSSVIDPWGQILFRGQPFEADAFALRVPLWLNYQPITLYTRIGDQIPLGLVLFLALYLLWAGTRLGSASSDPLKES